MGLRSMLRRVVIGRPDGLRSRLRSEVGCFTWLDRAKPPGPRGEDRPEPLRRGGKDGLLRLLRVSEVPPGAVVEVVAGEQTLALVNVEGQIFAVDAVCAHAGGPLGEGTLDGARLTCPWHGWSYDVRTGESSVSGDVRVRTWPLRVVDGEVFLVPSPGR